MSFEHWNRFIESFKADQAARGTQRIRAETPTGSSGRGRQMGKAKATAKKEGQKDEEETEGKKGKAVYDDEQPGIAAAS